MSLLLVGLNHKSAPVEIREQLAFDEQSCVGHLQELTDGEIIREGLILSTCNRVEILIETESDEAFDKAVEFLACAKQMIDRFRAGILIKMLDKKSRLNLFRAG